MDLRLYVQVLWRFRLLVASGALLALTLAVFAYVRVGFDGISPTFSYRSQEVWQSESTLFVTQQGFPWGRTVPQYVEGDPETGAPSIPSGDPLRFSTLAVLYTHLANSDQVKEILLRGGPVKGSVRAAPYTPSSTSGTSFTSTSASTLPLISVFARAATPAEAVSLTQRGTAAFQQYLEQKQRAAGIAPEDRVLVEVIQRATPGHIVAGRAKTLPIIVALTVMISVLGLVFILENLRPRLGAGRSSSVEQPSALDARRSA